MQGGLGVFGSALFGWRSWQLDPDHCQGLWLVRATLGWSITRITSTGSLANCSDFLFDISGVWVYADYPYDFHYSPQYWANKA